MVDRPLTGSVSRTLEKYIDIDLEVHKLISSASLEDSH